MAMSVPSWLASGRSAAFEKVTDHFTFLERNERARQRSDQLGYSYGLYYLHIEQPGLTDYLPLVDELSLALAQSDGYVDSLAWLDSQTAVMTFLMNNENRLVARAIEMHHFLERFAKRYPPLRHYLGVTVTMGDNDSIDAMIIRAAMASSEGYQAESDHQTGTVRFCK